MFSGKKQFKGSCPFCENVIEYHILKFPIVNDLGEMICECNTCKKEFSIKCRNPDESYIVSGATKLDYLDYEVETPSMLTGILEKFEFKGDVFRETPKFDTNKYPLYCCESCESNLEEMAHHKLESQFEIWGEKLVNYMSIDIKGYGHLPEKSIIKINFECECNQNHDAIFYKDFNHNSFDWSQFLLANISSTKKLNDRIDRSLSKTDSMELLKKIIIRWELLFDKFFLIFPYAGHTRSSDGNIMDLWESIISQTHSNKLTIVTKTQSLNSYKNAVTNTIYDYDILERFGFTPNSIDSAIKHNKFHAKIYCGVSENHVESISGSVNLATGPSIEQLNFRAYESYSEFFDKYLKIFSSKKITENLFPLPKEEVKHDCHILLDERNEYKYEKVLKVDLAKNLFN